MAISIIDCMKDLANRGKTIICAIHQPSSEIFDNLFLMSEGHLAYADDIIKAHKFFSRFLDLLDTNSIYNILLFLLNNSIGFKCPNNYNPAEYFIKTLAISPLDNSRERIKVYKYFLIYMCEIEEIFM
jgi:ABC-type multidrug transport system ATPase subunit